MLPLVLLVFAVVALSSRKSSPNAQPSSTNVAPSTLYNWGVPLARPTGRVWPVVTGDPNRLSVAYRDASGKIHEGISTQRYFGASREGGVRRHAAIDLVANAGNPIVAMEDGRVLGSIGGYLGLDAVVIEHPQVVAVYAEIGNGALASAGLKPGDFVRAGQRIGTAAASSTGSHMLHLELWTKTNPPKHFTRWLPSGVPAGLLDPSAYLLDLAARSRAASATTSAAVAGILWVPRRAA